MSNTRAVTVMLSLVILAGGCGSNQDGQTQSGQNATTKEDVRSGLPEGSQPVELDPADFTTKIDNRYWPMRPGSRWVYRETDEKGNRQRVEVTVTDRIKTIDGVKARVVHDVVREGDELVEDTFDWYAQDRKGDIWYLGEDTKEYEGGKVVTTAGSWQAGVDGAQAGVILPAHPRPGMKYRQEYYADEAEDNAQILSLDEQAEVPFGHFKNVLLTKDYTPLEPKVLEYKLYAKDVGPVSVLGVSGGGGREELLRFDKAGK